MRLKPLVDVVIDHKNVNSALVVDGYQCIARSLSKVSAGTTAVGFDVLDVEGPIAPKTRD